MVTIIEYNESIYNTIYHISDIHIRNTELHVEEYLHVFNNLFNTNLSRIMR
jgi:hypothetical protein